VSSLPLGFYLTTALTKMLYAVETNTSWLILVPETTIKCASLPSQWSYQSNADTRILVPCSSPEVTGQWIINRR
jgi:hypothetical protein